MEDLIGFIKARVDDDERAAVDASQQAASEHWRATELDDRSVTDPRRRRVWGVATQQEIPRALALCRADVPVGARSMLAVQIARHDPARVCREVRAKRRILDQAEYVLQEADKSAGTPAARVGEGRAGVIDFVLRGLALPYADHPDYRPEWKL
jgi:hypothetical protein